VSSALNVIPIIAMSGGWLGPLAIFWLQVWGPLRPFDYPDGALGSSLPLFLAGALASVAVWWLPSSYYAVRRFERDGRIYEALGARLFRRLVPDADVANRARRRSEPGYRLIANRVDAAAFVPRTRLSEKAHLALLLMGALSALFAARLGWWKWAAYLALGNVIVNVYPILLQRYTRARLARVLGRRA
jgi:hypothetical protein